MSKSTISGLISERRSRMDVKAVSFLACISCAAYAGDTAVTLLPASQLPGSSSATMDFPLERSGDTGFDVYLNYHTVDGTAVAGVDYSPVSGTLKLPAGVTAFTLEVPLLPSPSGEPPSVTFSMSVDAASGIGPAPVFADETLLGIAASSSSVTVADINGDGRDDLIVTSGSTDNIAILFNTTPAGSSTRTFADPQYFSTGPAGNGPTFVTVADVNNDGRPDLVIGDLKAREVAVLLNATGAGSTTAAFSDPALFYVTGVPNFIGIADINGDGLMDIVVATESVNVLLNMTLPGADVPEFALEQSFPVTVGAGSLALADLNADGRPDVAVSNSAQGTLGLLLNVTMPGSMTVSLLPQQIFNVGETSTVIAADVNNDGRPDLITAWTRGKIAGVLVNTTEPGFLTCAFADLVQIDAGPSPSSISAADFDADGRIDLVASNLNDNEITLLQNATPAGSLQPRFISMPLANVGADNESFSVVAATLAGGAHPDLVVANENSAFVSVFANTSPPAPATSAFSDVLPFTTGRHPSAVALADVNLDGRLDEIVADLDGAAVSVLMNDGIDGSGNPSFGAAQDFSAGAGPVAVITADLTGVGKADLVVVNESDDTISILANTTTPGAASPGFAAPLSFPVGTLPQAIAVGDINGDGKLDLAVANYVDGTVSILFNTTTPGASAPTFAQQQVFTARVGASSIEIADFNGDGLDDVVVANAQDEYAAILLNTTPPGATTGSFIDPQVVNLGDIPSKIVVADVNSDGIPDLAATLPAPGEITSAVNLTMPGSFKIAFAQSGANTSGAGATDLAAGDIDGDGRVDLVVANSRDNSITVLLNRTVPGSSEGGFPDTVVYPTGAGPVAVVLGDVSGDGLSDISAVSASDDTLSVLLNQQYHVDVLGSPGMGTILHDLVFSDGFD